MAKPKSSTHVLTAYRLSDGVVVFLDGEGGWTEALSQARVSRTPEEAAELERQGVEAKTANIVVDPYLVDVAEEDGALHPVRMRERLRLAGPTVGHSLDAAHHPAPQMG